MSVGDMVRVLERGNRFADCVGRVVEIGDDGSVKVQIMELTTIRDPENGLGFFGPPLKGRGDTHA